MNSSSASRISVPISSAISATLANSAPKGLELEREVRPLRELEEWRAEGGLDLFREGLRFSGAGVVSAVGRCFRDDEVELDFVLWLLRGGGEGIVEGEK